MVVVYGVDSLWEKSKNDLKALGNLMMLSGRIGKPGNGILLLRDSANGQGLLDMGVDPAYLPGYVRAGDAARIAALEKLWGVGLHDIFRPVDLKEALERDQIKGLLVFGEDPLFETSNLKLTSGADFMVVVDSFMTATAMEADVLLPASLPIETEGTCTACDRRVQKTAKVFEPRTGMENRHILEALAEKMGIVLGARDAPRQRDQESRPPLRKVADGGFWGNGFLESAFITSDGLGRFAPSIST